MSTRSPSLPKIAAKKRRIKRSPRRPTFDFGEALSRLEALHGKAYPIPRFEPMEELISCILSQHTSDSNSFPAFTRMRAAIPSWEQTAMMPVSELADVIRGAGLANNKAKLIQACLREIQDRVGSFSLDHLDSLSDEDAKAWLLSLPGVGPKTAAITLSFALGRHAIPVDTHVYRVSRRLGALPLGVSENDSHPLLEKWVAKGDAFRYHVLLIQHGRKVCKAPTPDCSRCPLTDMCKAFTSSSGDIKAIAAFGKSKKGKAARK